MPIFMRVLAITGMVRTRICTGCKVIGMDPLLGPYEQLAHAPLVARNDNARLALQSLAATMTTKTKLLLKKKHHIIVCSRTFA